MSSRRLLAALCVMVFGATFSIGAFPALLPEIGQHAGLADWQLGTLAGAYGLARMAVALPTGLFITHHLPRAMVLGPLVLIVGLAVLTTGGSFAALVAGRAIMGVGHTLGMLSGLTAILRFRAGHTVASSLNAFECSAMVGILGGVGLLTLLPRSLSWNVAFVLTCAPIVLGLGALPFALAALPRARHAAAPLPAEAVPPRVETLDPPAAPRAVAVLAFVAGGTAALAYSTIEQFLIPVRAAREFGLDRVGVGRILMVAQVCDILALLPVGALADRRGARRVLGVVLIAFAGSVSLIGFGSLPMMVGGCALFGLSMAGWMLPLGLLRTVTPPAQVAWRTAVYRVGVDGGMFLGPFLSGLLVARYPAVLPAALTVALLLVGALLLGREREVAPVS